MKLTNRTLFGTREGFQHLDMSQNWKGDGDDRIVAARLEASDPRLVMNDHLVGSLIDSDHPRPVADAVSECREKGTGQLVRSAGDLAHVRVIVPTIFTEQLEEGGVHHGFLVVEQAKHLDH